MRVILTVSFKKAIIVSSSARFICDYGFTEIRNLPWGTGQKSPVEKLTFADH